MPARPARFGCVLLFLAMVLTTGVSRPQAPQPPGSILIDNLGEATRTLSGPWRFHPGDNPSWASPSIDDSRWELLSAERPWGAQGHVRYTGWAWYRLNLTVRTTPDASSPLSLLVPHVNDVYEVYWNGDLVGHNGHMPPYPIWYYSERPQLFPLGNAISGVLAVRVWRAPPLSDDSGELGGFAGAPLIGVPKAIAAERSTIDYRWLRNRQFLFGEHLIYALIALLSFLVWWRNRKQWLLLWMVAYALAPLVPQLLLGSRLPCPYVVAMGLSQPANSILDISLWFLLLYLLHLDQNRTLFRLIRIFAVISITLATIDGLLITVALQPKWTAVAQAGDAAITAINTLLQMLPLVLVGLGISRREHLWFGSWLVAVFAFLDGMISVLLGALSQGQRFTGWTIADKIASPLFTIYGNQISLPIVSRAILLVVIVCAVYVHYRDEQRHQLAIASEFDKARELQRMLIPETQHATPGYALTCSYRPALEVGGDFFQLIPIGVDGSALLILGDVSGHGLKAALSVSYVIGLLRVLAELFPEPGPLLTQLNRCLCGQLKNGFVTCIAAKIDQSGSCILAGAGHPPPFLNCSSLEIPGELPLGINASVRYHQAAIQLHPGDHLALYTDGLLEARSKTGELYGFERLEKLFATYPTATDAAEAAIRFGQDDDVTVVALTYVADRDTCLEGPVVGTELCHTA